MEKKSHIYKKWITINIVEKNSGHLKNLCFRGHRNEKLWLDIITAYYAIRDDP